MPRVRLKKEKKYVWKDTNVIVAILLEIGGGQQGESRRLNFMCNGFTF